MELEKWAICMTTSFYYQDKNSCRFSYFNLVVPVRFFLPAFLDSGLPRGNRLEGNAWVPCEVPSLPNPTTRKGWPHHRGLWPLLSSNSDVGSFTSHKNNQWKCCETGPTVFRLYPRRLDSLTIWRSHLLQRQHFLLSHLKTLSVGPTGVWTCDLVLGRPVLSQLS